MLDPGYTPTSPAALLASNARTVGDLFLRRVDRDGDRLAFRHKVGGRWTDTLWSRFYRHAASTASWLIEQGIAYGDKVCIIGSTRPEWCVSDLGGQLAGAVTLGAYTSATQDQLAHVLAHSDTRFVFAEGPKQVEDVLAIRERLPLLEGIVVWDTQELRQRIDHDERLVSFRHVLTTPADRRRIDDRVDGIDREATAIIVYTSGTTGPPKGAMISHGNILSCLAGQGENPLEADDMGLSFLPMAHVAERVAGFYGRISNGTLTSFASSIPQVLEEIQEVRPTIFGSVPRIFEKAYAKIFSDAEHLPPKQRRAFHWAETIGRQVVHRWQQGQPIPAGLRLKYRLADRLVFSKVRMAFGGRVRHFVTGAAPISPDILEFFWAAGFRIFEVYGMTEATVITHGNRRGQVRLGSVGKAMSYVEDRIADDGEILLRGPVVFQGYYKDPEATAAAIDADGWLHTGDIGDKDDEGYLYIRGRKKHVIITAGGKNISPANIENVLKGTDPLISQVHAHGDRRPYLTALVTLHPTEAIGLAREAGDIEERAARRMCRALRENPLARPIGLDEMMAQVTARQDVRARVVAAIASGNQHLSRVESVKRVHLLHRELSVEEDELTPTLKVKRRNIEAHFAEVFDRLYDEEGFGLVVIER